MLHTHIFTISCPWFNKSPPLLFSPTTSLGGSLLSDGPPRSAGLRSDEEDSEKGDMAFLKDLLSPGPGVNEEFSKEWQDAFGMFDPPSVPPVATGGTSSGQAAGLPSDPPSPTGFLPSQLLDHSLSSTG